MHAYYQLAASKSTVSRGRACLLFLEKLWHFDLHSPFKNTLSSLRSTLAMLKLNARALSASLPRRSSVTGVTCRRQTPLRTTLPKPESSYGIVVVAQRLEAVEPIPAFSHRGQLEVEAAPSRSVDTGRRSADWDPPFPMLNLAWACSSADFTLRCRTGRSQGNQDGRSGLSTACSENEPAGSGQG